MVKILLVLFPDLYQVNASSKSSGVNSHRTVEFREVLLPLAPHVNAFLATAAPLHSQIESVVASITTCRALP